MTDCMCVSVLGEWCVCPSFMTNRRVEQYCTGTRAVLINAGHTTNYIYGQTNDVREGICCFGVWFCLCSYPWLADNFESNGVMYYVYVAYMEIFLKQGDYQ